jgi:hypothetical protein
VVGHFGRSLDAVQTLIGDAMALAGGGSLSIEFVSDPPDADAPRLGAWLELRGASRASALLHVARRPGVHHRSAAVTICDAPRPGLGLSEPREHCAEKRERSRFQRRFVLLAVER